MRIAASDVVLTCELDGMPETTAAPPAIVLRSLTMDDLDLFAGRDRDRRRLLEEAQRCFVACLEDRPVHHTCIATAPFVPPGISSRLRVGTGEAYVYNVFTRQEARGQGLAPRVLEQIHRQLAREGIRVAFAHVWSGNVSSRRLFEKCGYHVTGRLRRVIHGDRGWWAVTGPRPRFEARGLCLPGVAIYSGGRDPWARIREELEPHVREWRSRGTRVALFGAGGDAQGLLASRAIPADLPTAVYDNNQARHGERFGDTDLPIQPPAELPPATIDIVVITSRTYQAEMHDQLRGPLSWSGPIVLLHPHVGLDSPLDLQEATG